MAFLNAAVALSQPLPAIVITDLKMPRMSGLDLTRAIKEDVRLAKVPIAILTSSGEERDREEALKFGAQLCFQKPMTAAEFSAIGAQINEVIGLPGVRLQGKGQ